METLVASTTPIFMVKEMAQRGEVTCPSSQEFTSSYVLVVLGNRIQEVQPGAAGRPGNVTDLDPGQTHQTCSQAFPEDSNFA